jgi:F0F1-type ATP synthase assembly protein I
MKEPSKKKIPQENKNQMKSYAKYTGIAFQMAAIMALGVWGGIQLDKIFSLQFPVFTLVLTLLSVVLAIYSVIRELLKK